MNKKIEIDAIELRLLLKSVTNGLVTLDFPSMMVTIHVPRMATHWWIKPTFTADEFHEFSDALRVLERIFLQSGWAVIEKVKNNE